MHPGVDHHPGFRRGKTIMSKKNNRTVYKRPDGDWVNKRNDANKASSVHPTQRDAEAAARTMLKNQGGGELTTKGVDGKIRSKDTIARPDPVPPKDTEH
jgi:hypothetical protein